jgi:hypothetical protein
MAIVIEAYTVVVPNIVLDVKYPGGRQVYERDRPNETYCNDPHLARVGFMAPDDATAFVRHLERKGLTPYQDGACKDVAVVSQVEGPLKPCGWLEFTRYRGVLIGWLAGTDMGDLHAPPGWNFERSMQYFSMDEMKDRLQYLRSEDGVDAYLDMQTGQEVYIGRAPSTHPSKKWWQFWR